MKRKEFMRMLKVSSMVVVLATSMMLGGCSGCGNAKDTTNATESTVNEEEDTEEVELKEYVKGLKDWNVNIGATDIDFMEGVTYDDKYVKTVTCDSSKVDLATEGTYSITYEIEGKNDKKDSVEKEVIVSAQTGENTDNTTSNNSSNSGSSLGSSSSSSSSSGRGSSSSSSSSSSATAHTHNWTPVYRTVHHDAVTHTEDQGHYETTSIPYWVVNGVEYSTEQEANQAQRVLMEGIADGSFPDNTNCRISICYRQVQNWVSNIVTVTDSSAWDEQVLDHYECSCGATK